MVEGEDREIEELLRRACQAPLHGPSPDLVARTLRRAQGVILTGDLLRLATLEALWERLGRRARGARRTPPREAP